jgi:hypothetical protein
MHPDVGVCSIGYDELIAVLLLRQQREHAVQPAPGLWNGRAAAVSARSFRVDSETSPDRPDQQRGGRRLGWLLGHASESQVRLQVAVDQAGSKHTGDYRNPGEAGLRPGRSRRRGGRRCGRLRK